MMKKLVNDYKDVLIEECEFYRNNWKGLIVANLTISTVAVLYMKRAEIREKINEKMRERTLRKEEEA